MTHRSTRFIRFTLSVYQSLLSNLKVNLYVFIQNVNIYLTILVN